VPTGTTTPAEYSVSLTLLVKYSRSTPAFGNQADTK
jgi:hypothetical protein